MKHLGDIRKINGAEIPVVDVITGGSPCQDLSIAGKRAGLAGERSGLFMDYVRIVKEMREHDRSTGRADEFLRPRYMVFENVGGLFSSNHGEDFKAVLTEIIRIAQPDAPDLPEISGSGGVLSDKWTKAGFIYDELAKWSIAWRLCDSQWWGVPQRRKRVALLADFNGLTAGDILFDPQYRREAEGRE